MNVAQEELNAFLAVAEDLRVKASTGTVMTPINKSTHRVPVANNFSLFLLGSHAEHLGSQ